jgi:NAD(P)-dependent dehydrogenase (short-subunit alcohol dehydrogenase family)
VCALIERGGRRAVSVKADVSIASEVAALVETVVRKLGEISIARYVTGQTVNVNGGWYMS